MRIRINKQSIFVLALILFVFISCAMTAAGISDAMPEVMAILWLAASIITIYTASNRQLRTGNDRIFFWLSFLISVFMVFNKYGFTNWDAPTLSKDASGFWNVANQYYQGNYGRVYTMFPYILNVEFKIFGTNIICCMIVNVTLMMLMRSLAFATMNELNISGRCRFLGSLFVCLLPYTFIMVAQLWRESIYFFFIMLSFTAYVRYVKSERKSQLYLAVLSLLPVLFLHIGYFPIAVVYFFDFFKNEKIEKKQDLLKSILLVLLFFSFVFVSSSFNSISYLTGKSRSIEGLIARFSGDIVGGTVERIVEDASSRYLAGVRIRSISALLIYGPLKWLFYLGSPLPMNWRGISDIVAFFFDGVFHLTVLVVGIHGVIQLKRDVRMGDYKQECRGDLRILQTGLWAVALCAFVFGVGTGTAGTAMRHRDVMIGMESVLLAMSVENRRPRNLKNANSINQ